jgi:hypothetical protein
VEYSLKIFIEKYHLISQQIVIDFATDGVPTARSSGSQIWPILGNVGYSDILMFGVFHGNSKPKNANLFLSFFVYEVNQLIENGLDLNGQEFSIRLRCFVADSPAKSMALYVKGHTGFASCTKCEVYGSTAGKNTRVFRSVTAELRTDHSFRNRMQASHHKSDEQTEMEKILNFDIVDQIVVDYMHAALLGTMRQTLKLCIRVRKETFSFKKSDIELLSNSLSEIKLPAEFQRQPRSLKQLDNYKATEYRNILFYLSVVIFKDIMNEHQFNHFLYFFCAMRILADKLICQVPQFNKLAESYLKYFVVNYGKIYLETASSFNNHNLIHLPFDVMNFGPLDSFSAFRFENNLQKVKKMVKKSTLIVEQLHNRLHEFNNHVNDKITDDSVYPILLKRSSVNEYEEVQLKEFLLATKFPDNFCLVGNKILKISKIEKKLDGIKIYGQYVINTVPQSS